MQRIVNLGCKKVRRCDLDVTLHALLFIATQKCKFGIGGYAKIQN
jgi:hypothetical protein